MAARFGTAQGCPFFPSLPEEAGGHENTGLTSELGTSHALAMQGDSGSPLTVLLQNPTRLQVNMESGAPGASHRAGTLALLSSVDCRQRAAL